MSHEEYLEAKEQFEQYWHPVADLFEKAATRADVQRACRKAQELTGLKYCFGIGYHGEPMVEAEEEIAFHGWLYDKQQEMISVWYTHGD
jgi:hypothetical protein